MEKEEKLKLEIGILLKKFNQLTRDGLRNELKDKGIQFTDQEMANAVGSMFLEDKILLTDWS